MTGTKIQNKCAYFIILMGILLPAQQAFATDTITMAFTIDPSESVTYSYYELVFTEAFRRLGIDFHYKIYPPARASSMVNSGEIDGEALRSRNYNSLYTNIVPVDESIFSLEVQAFVADPDIRLDSWESLRGTNYRVEYYRSAWLVEQKLREVVNEGNLSVANNHIFALRKLVAGRLDVYIDSASALSPLLDTPEFRDSGIRPDGVLMEVPMYSFLHEKHADLALKLAEVLSQMKEEGLVGQYMQQARQKFAGETGKESIF